MRSAPRSSGVGPSSSRWRSEVPLGELLRDPAQRQAGGGEVGARQAEIGELAVGEAGELRRDAMGLMGAVEAAQHREDGPPGRAGGFFGGEGDGGHVRGPVRNELFAGRNMLQCSKSE